MHGTRTPIVSNQMHLAQGGIIYMFLFYPLTLLLSPVSPQPANWDSWVSPSSSSHITLKDWSYNHHP